MTAAVIHPFRFELGKMIGLWYVVQAKVGETTNKFSVSECQQNTFVL